MNIQLTSLTWGAFTDHEFNVFLLPYYLFSLNSSSTLVLCAFNVKSLSDLKSLVTFKVVYIKLQLQLELSSSNHEAQQQRSGSQLCRTGGELNPTMQTALCALLFSSSSLAIKAQILTNIPLCSLTPESSKPPLNNPLNPKTHSRTFNIQFANTKNKSKTSR